MRKIWSPNQQMSPATAGRPTMCRNCGAIVAADESVCEQCGTPALSEVAPAGRRFVPDLEEMRFVRAVLARPAPFTFLFLTANIFLYLLMTFSGGANGDVLIAYGAKLNYLIDHRGEWWRFVTPIFLHVSMPGLGPLHLLANMYGLWVLGPYVERLYGSAKFVVFWIATGIAGVAASYLAVVPEMPASPLARFLLKTQDNASAGASGALFGLIGVLFVFGIKYRHELPGGFQRAFGTGMLPTILINLFIGYTFPFIDNAAHLGGLVAGAVLALLFDYKRPGKRGVMAIAWHTLQIAALLLVIGSFALVWQKFNGPRPDFSGDAVSRLTNIGALSVQNYLNAINEGQQAYVLAFNNGDVSRIEQGLTALDRAPRLDDTADALRNELKLLLVRVRRFVEEAPAGKQQSNLPSRRAEQNNLGTSFVAWQERLGLWLELEGHKYGVRVQKPATANSTEERQK